jgi:uncharacterized RDD family membrane protein YckC
LDKASEWRRICDARVAGRRTPPEARFCAKCGAALVETVEVPSPAVVPEAVVEYAGFWIRFIAAVIDIAAVWIISYAFSFSFVPLRSGLGLRFGVYLLSESDAWLIVAWLYLWLFTGLKGQTPGKMLVKIKVINSKGNKPGLGRAALREIIGKTISYFALLLGYLLIAFDKEKRGLHDKIAGTYVVKVSK